MLGRHCLFNKVQILDDNAVKDANFPLLCLQKIIILLIQCLKRGNKATP